MHVDIWVDGTPISSDAYMSTDPDGERRPVAPEPDNINRILSAFLVGSEAELRTRFGEELGQEDSTKIPLTGFKEAAVWVLARCMAAADIRGHSSP